MTVARISADWRQAVDQVVDELLDVGGFVEPPVEPLELSRRLRITVAIDASQPTRGRLKRLAGQPSIFVRPDERPERICWAVAHELGELLAWRVARVAGDPGGGELPPGQRESLASDFAARLLIPTRWLRADLRVLDGDLPALKSRYATASHELIAFRMLEDEIPSVVSVFDEDRLVRRRSSDRDRAPPLQPIERRAQGDAHRLGLSIDLRHGPFRTQAWPIHETGRRREILRTTLQDADGQEEMTDVED